MVKFGKNKFKAINKIAKKQKVAEIPGASNKVLKKKVNAEKKVTFQKEVLKDAVAGNSPLVKNVTASKIVLRESKKAIPKEVKDEKKPPKPVEKRKKRQKTQIDDRKLMLRLMKNQSK